jgi:hypothetical protein
VLTSPVILEEGFERTDKKLEPEEDDEDAFMRELQALDTSPSGVFGVKGNDKKDRTPERIKKSPSTRSPYRATHVIGGSASDQKSSSRPTAAQEVCASASLHEAFVCSGVRLVIEDTHGDRDYVGLSGISLYAEGGQYIRLSSNQVDANPRDMGVIGYADDVRTPDKLVNGVNDTTADNNMWMIPFTKGAKHTVTVTFGREVPLMCLQIWNFNKVVSGGDNQAHEVCCEENLLRGVSLASIELLCGSSGYTRLGQVMLRRAPGCDMVHFHQTMFLDDVERGRWRASKPTLMPKMSSYVSPRVNQDYETPILPTGMLWKFSFFENYNDGYYIGLDGIEMFDEKGAQLFPIEQGTGTIDALPHSLHDVALLDDDRIPESLFFPPVSSNRQMAPGQPGHRGWLAPLSRCMTQDERARSAANFSSGGKALYFRDNALFVMFHKPVSVSLVRLYNYSKTPSRGVKFFGVQVDGNDVFMGTLKSADQERCVPGVGSANAPPVRLGQSVLFSVDPKLAKTEKDRVTYSGTASQDVLCINERKVMVRSKTMYDKATNPAAEGIRSDLSKRPSTAAVGGGPRR